MPGAPSASSKGAGVQEQIKNAYDRPYLPGSTLKGALRSILFWASYAGSHKKPNLDALRFSRSWAAQDLERDFFGRDPNHDWLRALHVEDSAPLEPPKLRLQQVRVYSARTPGAPGAPVDVEAAPMRVAFSSRIRLDEYFLHADIARKLGWPSPAIGSRAWPNGLRPRESAHRARAAFFRWPLAGISQVLRGPGCPTRRSGENEFFAQIGWGAGWESKTLGSELLATDKVAFENVLDRFRMTRGRRQAGDAFPVSRVVALDDTAQPYAPLGWVKVRLEGYEPTKGGAP
jgi:CRISPR-associated protein Csm5